MHSRARPPQWQELHRETTLFAGQFCHRPGHGSTPRPPTGTPSSRAVTCRPCATTTAGPSRVSPGRSEPGGAGGAAGADVRRRAGGRHPRRPGGDGRDHLACSSPCSPRMLIACGGTSCTARTWARSPIVVVQVMALGLAWNFLRRRHHVGLGRAGRRRGRRPRRDCSIPPASRRSRTIGPATSDRAQTGLLERRTQLARVRVSSRDTCIWLTPISAAISDWVLFLKNRSSRIRFSAAGQGLEQRLDRLPDLDLLELLVVEAHHLQHRHAAVVAAVVGRVEAQRGVGVAGLDALHDLLHRAADRICQLARRRRAARVPG